MNQQTEFDVIIIGGSYAGLSAAMALGRSFKNVLIIDDGKPCNRQTPHSHNFLTRDGETPAEIARKAKDQVTAYTSIHFFAGRATAARREENQFRVETGSITFGAKKLLLATGLRDKMPAIDGFAECWGISVIHCPYCHGYEVANKVTGILANGEMAFELAKLISNWTKSLTVFTNGRSNIDAGQLEKLKQHKIAIVETPIVKFEHLNGQVSRILFNDDTQMAVDAIYARPEFEQSSEIAVSLGCALTKTGLIEIDTVQHTSIPGVFAAGDNSTMFRALSMVIAAGTMAGAMINKELIEESF